MSAESPAGTSGQEVLPAGAPLTPPSPAGAAAPVSRTGRRVFAIGALAVVGLAGALAVSTLPRWRQERDLDAATAEAAAAPQRVTVSTAHQAAPDAERVLPGNCLPLMEAAIYARTTGYLKRRLVDIGDRVGQDQLLAEISAPDIDAQLAQAQANLAQARANLVKAQADEEFANIEEKRYRGLLQSKAVTDEDFQTKVEAAKVAAAVVVAMQAAIKVNEAAVQRFVTLQGFQKITAPFPGVITARTVDAGDLIPADSPTTTREMFHLMRTDVLRVFVNVPQVFSGAIKVGQDAVVFNREDPKTEFPGKVTRTADALDPNTRTLLTEVQLPNPKDVLRPGMYLEVRFNFSREFFPVLVPDAALIARPEGTLLAVLDDKHAVHYRKVKLGRDWGTEIEVTDGVKPGESVVVYPGDALPEGTVVDPVVPPVATATK